MELELGEHTRSVLPQPWLTYPLPRTVAAAGRSDADIVAAALGEGGFARDGIEIVTADEVNGLGDPTGGSGLRRLLVRLQSSLGDDLDELEAAQHELMGGYALIQIRVHGREVQVRAHAILRQHGGHDRHSFGRWTITSIDRLGRWTITSIVGEAKAEASQRPSHVR